MHASPDIQIVEILLVEDNPGDVRLMQEILKECKILNRLQVVRDGAAAVQCLRRQRPYENTVRPDLILLDLNLPKLDGREVLQEIKWDSDLRLIPVVILTTSERDQDILESYRCYANAYVTKPLGLDQFVQVVQSIGSFWLGTVRLPRNVR